MKQIAAPRRHAKSNTETILPHASLKKAVQERITPADHSSIIPGINVNELKRSLDLLKYALDYSEAIVDTVRTPLIVLNKEQKILTANRSFYDTFKLTSVETENQLIYKLDQNAWDIPKLKILLEKILPKNTHFDNYEVEIDHPKIGHRIILLSARRTYRQVNNTEAILLAFEDITARKLLERQKDDFIGIVSHELKTPLTSILLYAQLLEKHLEKIKDKKGMYFLSKLSGQTERLTQLMASFVNVYEIQNGKLALRKKKFPFDKLVEGIIADFQFTTESHTIEHYGETKMTISADRDRVAQVLVNLISNAIKYSPKADKIIITSAYEKGKVIVCIQDFGFGIAENEQNKIFERFFRTSNKRESNILGLGLGLYISDEIIKRHKGKIWVKSKLGKGSKFYFSLPIS